MYLVTTTAAGAVLIVTALHDVFRTLFHPRGEGRLARTVMSAIWRLTARLDARRPVASMAGPLGMISVIALWGSLVVLGWTLVYLAHVPDGLSYAPALAPEERNDLLDALYLSLVTVATLGFGDIVPTSPWLRVAAPLEALVGFVLLTAAVSWVLQVYPALHRRRVLALRLSTLRRVRRSHPDPGVDRIPTGVLIELGEGMAHARTDLSQYAATYYFRDANPETALAANLPYALQLSEEAQSCDHLPTRMAGAMLSAAVDDLAELLDRQFLRLGADTATVLRAYATDHRHGP
jgi:hypothetical protein